MKNQFTQQLESVITKTFPNSFVSADIIQITGEPFCVLKFHLAKDKSELPGGYAENDNTRQSITIHGFNADFSMKNILFADGGQTNCYVKPPKDSHLVYGRLKTGWRNFKADSDKTIQKIDSYFSKLKELLNENFDNLTEDTQKMMTEKGYKK